MTSALPVRAATETYIANSATPGAAFFETVKPYSGPTASFGGNSTIWYFDDALIRDFAPEQ